MAEQNCEIDLQDFMTDDILALMKNNCIDPNDELVDLNGELEPISWVCHWTRLFPVGICQSGPRDSKNSEHQALNGFG